MDKARELLATDPEKAATILTGTILKRLDKLEEQNKYLTSRIVDCIRGGNHNRQDLEFAAKFGDAETIRKVSIHGAGSVQSVMPIIHQRKDGDKIISQLSSMRGGKTYRRKLKGVKHTRKQ